MGEPDRMLVAERSYLSLRVKVKEWFWSCNWLLIYAPFLAIVPWHLHIRRFCNFSVIVTWEFHIWNLFFSGSFVQKGNSFLLFRFICSEIHWKNGWQLFYNKRFPAFIQIIQKTASLFLQTHIKKTLWVKNTVLLATVTSFASYPIADITLY